jgi:3'-phosphoadenosine 5'-phosphosulfate sulfotransferase (PAPS reductase)/FAD synthetase
MNLDSISTLILGRFEALRHFFRSRGRRTIAGISGGQTSATMAALCDASILFSFQNTGKEERRTYLFLERLAEALRRQITWLEYRPPAERGAPPAAARFAVVNAKTADRSGGPFEMMMDAINAYRRSIGKGPIAPWWRSRICTTYMKTRLARRFVESLGWDGHDEFVGLRADEPTRVERLRSGVPKRIGRFAPLSAAGITVQDVAEFWAAQPFQLGLPSHLGNCTGCFLKDQTDLSRALDETGDVEFWASMQEHYPGFGGKNFAGYRQLATEASIRRKIEAALRAGIAPQNEGIDPKRFKLVVIQERKRIAGEVAQFSCACEGSDTLAQMDDVEENEYIASLPSEDD